jgi:hypothetical protein
MRTLRLPTLTFPGYVSMRKLVVFLNPREEDKRQEC